MREHEPRIDTAFERDGFVRVPRLVGQSEVSEAIDHMDAVVAGGYETGTAPHWRRWNPGDDELRLRKIDQPQLCDRTIQRLIASDALGRQAARLYGARTIQVWGVQLLLKPAGGAAAGTVGWHQDQQYWLRWWTPDSELFTCWLALSDVTVESGAMRFVPGSHHWGLQTSGDFFEQETDRQREQIAVPEGEFWQEASMTLGPGEASFHHQRTFHGSGPNSSTGPRRSFAIHLRTENSEVADLSPLPSDEATYMSYLSDAEICPVIYRAPSS